jgi:hypothetical protein
MSQTIKYGKDAKTEPKKKKSARKPVAPRTGEQTIEELLTVDGTLETSGVAGAPDPFATPQEPVLAQEYTDVTEDGVVEADKDYGYDEDGKSLDPEPARYDEAEEDKKPAKVKEPLFDPYDHNVDVINQYLAATDDLAERSRVLRAEKSGKNRSTVGI